MLIAMLVIGLILSCVALSVVILTPDQDDSNRRGQPFAIRHLVAEEEGGKFKPRRFNGTWLSANELLFRDATEGLSILDVDTLEQTQIVENSTFRRFNVVSYSLSPNRKFLLLVHNAKERYRYSTFAQYTIYKVSTGSTIELSINSPEFAPPSSSTRRPAKLNRLLHAQWVPSPSSSATPIVFVEDYNVYYVSDVGMARSKGYPRVFPISPPGTAIDEVVIHGVPDWIYEEDILKQGHALWVSPNGRRIVYATFNDTLVNEVRWDEYYSFDGMMALEGGLDNSYPSNMNMRYPKAGSTNPSVSLWLVELDKGLHNLQAVEIRSPPHAKFKEHYLVAVSFSPDSKSLAVNWMSRTQDEGVVFACSHPLWTCKQVYREDVTGWSSLYSPVLFSSEKSPSAPHPSFLVKASVRDGKEGAFNQLILVEPLSSESNGEASPTDLNTRSRPLPLGHIEVVNLLRWDERNGRVYFLGIPSSHPSQRHLYLSTTRWNPGDQFEPVRCLTCKIPTEHLDDRKCLYTSAHINQNFSHYALECLGPDIPATYLMALNFQEVDNNSDTTESSPVSMVLDSHDDLVAVMSSMARPNIEFMSIPAEVEPLEASNQSGAAETESKDEEEEAKKKEEPIVAGAAVGPERTLQAKLYLPPHLKKEDHVKYPLVLHVYGGPGHQLVTDKWKTDFNWLMSTQLGFVVMEVDGAGSGGRGQSLAAMVKHKLGGPEVHDQIRALKYLSSRYHWIDPDRIAVTGVSYGGYMTVRLLSTRVDEGGINFRCGAAIAPVTDWKYYESVYSERYLGLPSENENGYIKSSLLDGARYLRGKDLFLAHGMADKNVHLQNSMVLSKELVRHEIQFQQQIYPDEGHSLKGVRAHLFTAVARFLRRCLQPERQSKTVSSTSSSAKTSFKKG